MADLNKQNRRVNLLDFIYDDEGQLESVTAQVGCDIFEGEIKLTQHVETIPSELTTGERTALTALITKLLR